VIVLPKRDAQVIRKGALVDKGINDLFNKAVEYPFQRWLMIKMIEEILKKFPEMEAEIMEKATVMEMPFPENLYFQVLGRNYQTPPQNWENILSNAFRTLLLPAEETVILQKYRDRLTFQAIADGMQVTKEAIRVSHRKAIESLKKNTKLLFVDSKGQLIV